MKRSWFASLLLAAQLTAAATPGEWRQYENSHFVAYSNASEKNVKDVLVSLEQFRAAALQIPSMYIPEGRPKTAVILPATRAEFITLTQFDTIAGFATTLGGRSTIVLPADQTGIDLNVVIGHEFAHTLLFNEFFDYPSWYAEGFAEIASSIVIDHKKNTFEIGARRDLRRNAARPRVDWNNLVDTAFNAHALGNPELATSAYAQDWLLVHFLTVNESVNFASELNRYFASLNNGLAGQAAFTDAFGRSASDIGEHDLPAYLRHLSNRKFAFDASFIDPDFDTTDNADETVRPMLKFLRDHADVMHGRNVPSDPERHLPGRWDWLRLEDQCADPMTFRRREDSGVLVLESFYSDDDADPVPALFRLEHRNDGALLLTNITSAEFPQVRYASDYQAIMKSADVMCFDAEPLDQGLPAYLAPLQLAACRNTIPAVRYSTDVCDCSRRYCAR